MHPGLLLGGDLGLGELHRLRPVHRRGRGLDLLQQADPIDPAAGLHRPPASDEATQGDQHLAEKVEHGVTVEPRSGPASAVEVMKQTLLEPTYKTAHTFDYPHRPDA